MAFNLILKGLNMSISAKFLFTLVLAVSAGHAIADYCPEHLAYCQKRAELDKLPRTDTYNPAHSFFARVYSNGKLEVYDANPNRPYTYGRLYELYIHDRAENNVVSVQWSADPDDQAGKNIEYLTVHTISGAIKRYVRDYDRLTLTSVEYAVPAVEVTKQPGTADYQEFKNSHSVYSARLYNNGDLEIYTYSLGDPNYLKTTGELNWQEDLMYKTTGVTKIMVEWPYSFGRGHNPINFSVTISFKDGSQKRYEGGVITPFGLVDLNKA